jgi:hypothetical protein
MKRHKLNFGNRSALQQLAICQRFADSVAKLPADSVAKLPADSVAKLPAEHRAALAEHPIADTTQAAAAACAAVEAAKAALKMALHHRQTKLQAARDCANNVGLKLSALTAGDPAVLLAAGLEIARDKSPVGKPDAPGNVRADVTEFEGRVKLRWQRPVRRCWFDVQATTDPTATTGWKKLLTCFKQTCEVSGLESGKKYWFRLAASNAHGQGPWSQAASAWVK